ncbi:P-loop containing nucleoside triphosphate hydrolase protein [Podospora conica]|nr:P-loop containing nucleoside triphosphate hydrolase protein [Schizothecium conicum]
MPGHVTLLVVGPSGSGKSTFISSVSGPSKTQAPAMIGHGLDPCTVSCSLHEVIEPSSGTRLTLVDTPGFNDQTRNDIDILHEIALFLSSKSFPPISAVVFTHAITDIRVTGSSRMNLNIAKALCGETFYPRLALLTTMWNKVPSDEVGEQCKRREDQILKSPTFWGEMLTNGCRHARFDSCTTSGMDFLKQLLNLGEPNTDSFQFQQELRAGLLLENTKAGMIILAEREKRQRQLEEELQELQELREVDRRQKKEWEQATRTQHQEMNSRDDQRPTARRGGVVFQAPGEIIPMAYGPFNMNDETPRRSVASSQQLPGSAQTPVEFPVLVEIWGKVCKFLRSLPKVIPENETSGSGH